MRREGTTLFRQTLAVLVGAVLLSAVLGTAALVLSPGGVRSIVTLSGIARQLAEPGCDTVVPPLEHAYRLSVSRRSQPPQITAGMSSNPLLESQLARALNTKESAVRLGWSPDSEIRTGRPVAVTLDGRSTRLEETIFLGKLVFARQGPGYWCVGEIPPPRWYDHWKASIALNQLLTLTVFLLLAWWFARRLSRPIHDFATAADAAGHDEQAPLLEEKGPREMRVAARALNSMQARIRAQAREREAMIGSIAHDLRTPLSRIAFRVETASPEVRDSVQRDIEQMNAMITTTLEFSRESTAPREERIVDLHHLLQVMVEDERAVGHAARLSADSGEIPVRGNDVQLSRLFQNLLDNARNFGGAAEVYLRRSGGNAIVDIGDRGPGIDQDRMEEMLQPFTRGEPSRNRETGGMGLGLSITRIIVERHGGDIRLGNREGGGLLVRVTLPLA